MVHSYRNWRENADDLEAIEKSKIKMDKRYRFAGKTIAYLFGMASGLSLALLINYNPEAEQTQESSLDSIKHISLFEGIQFGGRDLGNLVGTEPTLNFNDANYVVVNDNGWPVNLRYIFDEKGKVNYEGKE